MSDYSFMKSGFTQIESNTINVDMMKKLVALVKTLMEDAVRSAEKFVISCGRKVIQAEDIAMALQYETHEFLLQGDALESKFQQNLQSESTHTYETDDEESEDDEASSDEENVETEEYSMALQSSDEELIQLHTKFLKYHSEWDQWEPTDPITSFLKSSVDKTTLQCGVSLR